MFFKLNWKASAVLLAALLGGTFYLQNYLEKNKTKILQIEETEKVSQIRWKSKTIQLENGLTAFLLEDPDLKNSSASIDVAVGSFSDPDKHEGMAHFIEHMLFLGTKKFPVVGEFDNFINQNQGTNNAWTADEHTNYQLEINHDAFHEALDRFGQFFVSPSFQNEYIEKERNAIHNEHQKNLQSDDWRIYRIRDLLARDGHPRRKFGTGDMDTLKSATRDDLVKFYESHYSANLMKLAVFSNRDLATQEKWVREIFSAVPNRNLTKPSFAPSYLLDKQPKMVEVKPIAPKQNLYLVFPGPSPYGFWRTKPDALITFLIGDEGKGSLLSYLKKEGLATGLSAGYQESSYEGLWSFGMELTKKGMQERKKVIDAFFSYVHRMQERGLPKYLFDERKQMADVDFKYRAPLEGMDQASKIANAMQYYEPHQILEQISLYYDYSENDFKTFLNTIQPENMLTFYVAPDAQTNLKEKFYGVEYGIKSVDAKDVQPWKKMVSNSSLDYPEENLYLPKNFSILTNDKENQPYRILDSKIARIWFMQDKEILQPKGEVSLIVRTPKVLDTIENAAVSRLYGVCIDESLNEWKYSLRNVGLEFEITRVEEGIQISVSGYSDHLAQVLKEVLMKIGQLEMSENLYMDIKERILRDMDSFEFEKAFKLAKYELDFVLNKNKQHRKDLRPVMEKIKLSDVKTFAEHLFDQIYIEGLAYGNMQSDQVKDVLNQFLAEKKSQALNPNQIPRKEFANIADQKSRGISKTSQSTDHAWVSYVQLGKREPKLDAVIKIADAQMGVDFYNKLRTEAQLGYIVGSFPWSETSQLGIGFIVQSNKHDPVSIFNYAEKWMETIPKNIQQIDDANLQKIKESVKQPLLAKERTIHEKMVRYWGEAIELEGNFNYRKNLIEAIDQVSMKELNDMFVDKFKKEARSQLAVFMYAKGAQEKKCPVEKISDSKLFKTQTQYQWKM